MKRSRVVAKNIFTSTVLQLVTIVCGFVLPRLIISTYGSETNGLISSITQFLAYITLVDGGIGLVIKAALYGPIAKSDNKKIQQILKASQKLLDKIVFLFIFYIILLCIFYPMLVKGASTHLDTIVLIVAIALSTIAEYSIGMIYRLYLQAKQATYITSIIQMATIVLNTVLSVILIKMGCSIVVVKICAAVVYFARAIAQSLYVRNKFNIKFRNASDGYALKGRWDGFIQHAATVVHENTDVVVLTIFSSTSEISVYAIYMMVLTGIRGVIQSFSSGIDAIFGDMYAKGEKENMNKKLRMYESFYYYVVTIIFGCVIALITPFVDVYTNGVTDANYHRPLFGIIMVLAQVLWAVRQPYSSIVFSAGRFKETRFGAIVEAVSNMVISVSLVPFMGIVGVAIGTLVAMTIRTINYIDYASKSILYRKRKIAYKYTLLAFVMLGCVFAISQSLLSGVNFSSYLFWVGYAAMMFMITLGVVTLGNLIFDRKIFFAMTKYIFGAIRRGKKDV